MRNALKIACLACFVCSGCGGGNTPVEPELDQIIPVHGAYLGQTPPGLTPQRFGPPAILATRNWSWHSSPGFSPDGMQMYWARIIQPGRLALAFSQAVSEGWSPLQIPSFSGAGDENEPQFSADGNSLLYVSGNSAGHVLRVTRSGAGWSQPQSLSLPFPSGLGRGWQFSMAADGSVYADGDYRQGNNMDLFRFPWTGDGYGSPVAVGVNTQYNEFAPCVAPDESYLIFVSNRPGGRGMHDLWITFKEGDGTWTEPLNMGPTINSSSEDGAPALTLDGLYLFFTTERSGDKGYNPYWVSTQVIQNLRSQAGF